MGPARAAAVAVGIALHVLSLCSAPPVRAAEEIVGSVKTLAGRASIARDGVPTPARLGFRLRPGDVLETGPDGRLGVILRDDSLISLGPSTTVSIERFLFAPAEGKIGLTARILRGTMAYLSGLIGRLAPESATFVTPVATIGVRGTHFAVQVLE